MADGVSFHPNGNDKVTVTIEITVAKKDKGKSKVKIDAKGDSKEIEKEKLNKYERQMSFKGEKVDKEEKRTKHTWELFIGDGAAQRELIVICAKKKEDGGEIYLREALDPAKKITHEEQEKILGYLQKKMGKAP